MASTTGKRETAYRTAAVKPPSTIMEWPVTYEAASEHSHSAASTASCGQPIRPRSSPSSVWPLSTLPSGLAPADAVHAVLEHRGLEGARHLASALMRTPWRVLERRGLGQRDQSRFGRRVQSPLRHTAQAVDRRGIDNCSAARLLRQYLADLLLQAQPEALQIERRDQTALR